MNPKTVMAALILTAGTALGITPSAYTPQNGDYCPGLSFIEPSHGNTSDPSLVRGWPVSLNTPSAGFPYTPTLYDINGNGASEIFLTGGHTFGLSGDGSFLPGWPTSEMAHMGYASTGQLPGPSCGDMNSDGTHEVLWSTRDWYAGSSRLWTFNGREHDGSDVSGFPSTAPDQSSNALSTPFVLGDATGDGFLEAATAHTLGNTGDYYRISAVDHTGALMYTTDLDPSESILNVYFGDADGNGIEEFFAVTLFSGVFRLHLLDAAGEHQPGYPLDLYSSGGGYLMFGPPIPADLDGDGDLELILGYTKNSTAWAMAVHHEGTPVSGFPIQVATGSQLFYLGLGDITGSGQPELLAFDNELGSGYRAWAIDIASGTALSGWPVALSNWPKGFPIVADVNDDGFQDILFTTDGGELYALSRDGTTLEGFPKTMGAASTSGPAVGDINGNGFYEIVAATWDGWVYAWSTEGVVADDNRDWPMRGVDPRNTGIYRGAIQSGIEDAPNSGTPGLLQNPVTGSAFFTTAQEVSAGEVEIFDIGGRLVARVDHVWHPGSSHGNGVYFARFRGTGSPALKFVLAR